MARRHNGEGSIYPYRNGFAAYVWIVTPTADGNESTSTEKAVKPFMRSGWR
jgi:hypothetical protein